MVLRASDFFPSPLTVVPAPTYALQHTHTLPPPHTHLPPARFLRYQPYDTTKGFKVHLKDAITYRPEKGYARLQAVLAAIMLRRTKDTQLHGRPIIELPKREQSLVQVGDTRRPPCIRHKVMPQGPFIR